MPRLWFTYVFGTRCALCVCETIEELKVVIFYALTWQKNKQANPCFPPLPPNVKKKKNVLAHEIRKLENTDMDHPGSLGKENNFQISSYLEYFPPD